MNMSKMKITSRSQANDAYSGEELLPLTESASVDDVMSSPENEQNETLPESSNARHDSEQSQKEPKKQHIPEEVDPDVKCGFGACKPDALQKFNNPKCLLFFLCYFAFLQGFIVNGINNVNTTTLERRFGFASSKVGMISSAYDVSAAILGVVISYIGSGKNKARYVALAAAAMSVGSFVMALPHFTTGLYQWGQDVVELCDESDHDVCVPSTKDEGLQHYLYIFLLGQFLHGVGGTTLYIVGVALMDDSVPASSSPLYIGIFYSFATFGPALGYVVGGQLLDVYVDFNEPEAISEGLTPDDPRWVGAWWVGFVVVSMLLVSVALPISAYGTELPTAKQVRATRVSQTHNDVSVTTETKEDLGLSIKDLPRSLWLLMRNPPFILLTIAGSAEGLATSGFATFMPKFIQNQFGTSASWASILGGLVAVPGAAGGQFAAGYFCKKKNLKVKGMLKVMIVACLLAMVLDNAVWIKCEQEPVAGVSTPYSKGGGPLPNLIHSCNKNCTCTSEYYKPVCSPHGVQYFSPCHAGCTKANKDGEGYENCTCLSLYENYQSSNSSIHVAEGKCTESCGMLYVFLVLLLLTIFFRFAQSPPALSVTLRCIHNSQRTFALGIQWFVVRLVGTMPGPVLYGSIIDNTCLVWRQKACGEQTSCWIYDNASMSRNFFFILITVKVTTFILFIIIYRVYKPPPDKMSVTYKNSKTVEISAISEETSDSEQTTSTQNEQLKPEVKASERHGLTTDDLQVVENGQTAYQVTRNVVV